MYTIQELNNTHCKAIIDLILPIQQEEFKVPVTLEGQPDLLNIEAFYTEPGGKFWGAFEAETLIGTIALIHCGHRTGAIRKMFVQKAYRGSQHGIAQSLLSTLIGYCRQQHIEALYLGTVDILKAALRFYEKNGFTRIDVTSLPSFFPRMTADNTFYYLSLKNHSQ